jgi:hypothetical protein
VGVQVRERAGAGHGSDAVQVGSRAEARRLGRSGCSKRWRAAARRRSHGVGASGSSCGSGTPAERAGGAERRCGARGSGGPSERRRRRDAVLVVHAGVQALERQVRGRRRPASGSTTAHKEEEEKGAAVMVSARELKQILECPRSGWCQELDEGASLALNCSGEVRLGHERGKQREAASESPCRKLLPRWMGDNA